MRRLRLFLFGVIFFIATPIFGGEAAQKETIAFLQKLQSARSGGFVAAPPTGKKAADSASLGATSAAVRTLHYLGAKVPDKAACVRFVESCFDPATGGFADSPGGTPNVFTTAVGAMAIVELKMPAEKYGPAAIKYLTQHVQSFEDIRIAAAALESLGKSSSRNEEWLREIRKMQNADGTFGKGAEQARATGGAVAAILRLGGTVADRGQVVKALKKGQRKTGGYGQGDAGDTSDLATTYRVMRTFMMLKSRPDDGESLQGLIAKCRNSDGGYGIEPGQASSVSGTYYATIIRRWLAMPPTP